MGRRKLLQLPAQASKDVKTISGILDKYATEAEEVIKDVFAWAKKHKFLVAFVVALLALKRYFLDFPEEKGEEDY